MKKLFWTILFLTSVSINASLLDQYLEAYNFARQHPHYPKVYLEAHEWAKKHIETNPK